MKTIFAAFLAVFSLFAASNAQTADEEAVKQAGLDYIESIYNVNPALAERSVHPELVKRGFFTKKGENVYLPHSMTFSELINLAKTYNKNGSIAKDAPKKVEIFEVSDQTASAKVTAVWGIDYLHLAKYEGKWKIINILWQSPPKHPAAATVDRLFDAMKAKDADAIRELFLPNGQLTAVDKPKTGEGLSTFRNFSADTFAKMIAGSSAGELIEKMPEKDVRVYGDAAVVTGRYTFNVGEKFSHCGTNAFHLIKTGAGWKIANGTSTLETAKCDFKFAVETGQTEALSTVKELFSLMTAHNPAEIIALHMPESQLTAVIKDREGKSRIENLSREAFSKFFETKRAEISEKMYDEKSYIFGDMAIVDGRYLFTVDGKLQHCGMNSFHLLRTAQGWKLGNSISTIEPNGCTEAEKAMIK